MFLDSAPLVSVIVPVFNSEKYLSKCLDSILNQDYPNIEVICIDDSSTDNSKKILEDYSIKEKKIKIIAHTKNRGPSAARNSGLDLARGKYILFVDGDDCISRELLYITVSCAEKNNLDEVSFDYKTFREDEEPEGQESRILTDGYTENVISGIDYFVSREKENRPGRTAWAWLYLRSFIEINGLRFYEGILHEDLLFYYNTIIKAKRVVHIEEDLYYYRTSEDSIMTGFRGNRAVSLYIVFSEIYDDWVKHEYTAEENQAIGDFMQLIWCTFQRALMRGENNELEVENNYARNFQFKLAAGLQANKYGVIGISDMEILKKQKKIMLFGMGNVAVEIVKQLETYHLYPDTVLVSKVYKGIDTFNDIPVKTLDEVETSEETAVIIATRRSRWEELEKMIRRTGFKIIIFPECRD